MPLKFSEGALLEANSQSNLVLSFGDSGLRPSSWDVMGVLHRKSGTLFDWFAEG